jgi:anti-sigma-K factor RskA
MPELHLLTGAYALDALDDVERAGFERHLRSCPACEIEVIEFHEATARLADRAEVAPPPYLRDAVLDQIARTRQVAPGAPGARHVEPHRPSSRRILATAVAAVALVGTVALGGVMWQAQRTAHNQVAVASKLTQVLTDPNRTEVTGKSAAGGTAAVVAAKGTAVFAASQLTALPEGKQYQLWLIRGKTISSEGLLKLKDGTGQTLVGAVVSGDVVAVSVEPKGGSVQPTTKPVVTLTVV